MVLSHYLNSVFKICFYCATINFVKIVLVYAAITKSHRHSGSNHRHIFFHNSGGWKSKNKMPTDFVPGKILPWFTDSPLLTVSSHGREWEISTRPSSFAHKDTNSIMWVLRSWPQLNLITSQRLHPKYHHIEGRGFCVWVGVVVYKHSVPTNNTWFETMMFVHLIKS